MSESCRGDAPSSRRLPEDAPGRECAKSKTVAWLWAACPQELNRSAAVGLALVPQGHHRTGRRLRLPKARRLDANHPPSLTLPATATDVENRAGNPVSAISGEIQARMRRRFGTAE